MTEADDDLRRAVAAAEAAARSAKEAVERMAADQPTRFERILEAITRLLTTFFDGMARRVRDEYDRARREGEAFVARILQTISRTLGHLGAAVGFGVAALIVSTIALIILGIGVVALLNDALGDPYGTLVTGGAFLVLGVVFVMLARGHLKAIAKDADTLSSTRRGR